LGATWPATRRARRRRPSLPLKALAGAGAWLPPDRGEPPSGPVERAELAGQVRSAVSALADRQCAAVELHQFQDRTYAEVAAAPAVSPKAAKSLLYRARDRLRASLGPFMDAGSAAGAGPTAPSGVTGRLPRCNGSSPRP
jgi:DNA-directed RNA polymerase specialized sigma24 family protein